MGLTADQIIALAPDSASAIAGRGLANAVKWQNLGASERALWGECKGSGARPYQAQVDLAGAAFKCSCPSRKFPCKHGLGLYLLHVANAEIFGVAEPPGWVEAWLASRDGREQKRTEPPAPPSQSAADPSSGSSGEGTAKTAADLDGQAKRLAERERRVAAGVAELEIWLQDVARGGLVTARGQGYKYFDAMAARLVDAQAPGLARMVKQLGSDAATPGWQDALLRGLGRLQLLCDAYRRQDRLPRAVVDDVRSLTGWTQREEELKDSPGARDHWYVAGTRISEEENLRVARTWLFGSRTGRRALLLQFSHGSQSLPATFSGGLWLDAELAFYPGNLPLRALVLRSEPLQERVAAATPVPAGNIAQARTEQARALGQLPWCVAWPVAIGPARIRPTNHGWRVRDEPGDELALRDGGHNLWKLFALAGGQPIHLFGALDGGTLTLCGAYLAPADAGTGALQGGFVPV